MNDTARLERWYRRMLTWYPAEHRRAYGDEMIGVLLASAPEGKRRPGMADALDLLKGGLLARLRPADNGDADPGWRDTFAVFSIAAPAMALVFYIIGTIPGTLENLLSMGTTGFSEAGLRAVGLRTVLVVAATVVPPVLALRGLRPTAILTAAMPAIFFGYVAVSEPQWVFSFLVWCAFLFPLEVLVLAISPGPKRGAALMTVRGWIVVTAAAGLLGLAASLPDMLLSHFRPGFELGYLAPQVTIISLPVIAVLAAIGLVLIFPEPIGRRLALLFAIPFYPAAIALTGLGALTSPDGGTLYGPFLSYPPAIALVGLVAILAWRSRHHGSVAS